MKVAGARNAMTGAREQSPDSDDDTSNLKFLRSKMYELRGVTLMAKIKLVDRFLSPSQIKNIRGAKW